MTLVGQGRARGGWKAGLFDWLAALWSWEKAGVPVRPARNRFSVLPRLCILTSRSWVVQIEHCL